MGDPRPKAVADGSPYPCITLGDKPYESESLPGNVQFDDAIADTTTCDDCFEQDCIILEDTACESNDEVEPVRDQDDKTRLSNIAATSSSERWVLDSDASECQLCAMAFTQMRRRHHCRVCGQVCCANCAPLTRNDSHFGVLKRWRNGSSPTFKRLCVGCHDRIAWSSDALPAEALYEAKNTFIVERATQEERLIQSFPC